MSPGLDLTYQADPAQVLAKADDELDHLLHDR